MKNYLLLFDLKRKTGKVSPARLKFKVDGIPVLAEQ